MYPYGASPEQMHTVARRAIDAPELDNSWQAMWKAIGVDKLLELLTESIEDGAIANAVWDVMMYNLLEQVPELQEAFYQAHKNKDAKTKQTIFNKFHLEAAMLLHKYVSGSFSEFLQLLDKTNEYSDEEHPRLPLIRRHLDFMLRTFTKVLDNLNETIQKETKARKELQEEEK